MDSKLRGLGYAWTKKPARKRAFLVWGVLLGFFSEIWIYIYNIHHAKIELL